MANFSSLNRGESLLAGNKKNDSMACKKGGGDAAKIAGAAIAGVAVAGALAVGAAQSSLFASGVGGTSATQAGAASSISGASSGVTSATGSAQSKATTAITQGPGAQSNATLGSAQGDVNSAQGDASQLAGERRAGADGQVAQSQSSVNNAQNYLASKSAAGQANATAEKTVLSGKVNSALATAPPPPAGLAKPAAGQLPAAPLPVNMPPPNKATDQSVAVPPSNLAIQAPANASAPTAAIKPSGTTQQTVQQEQLKQTALSKDEIDACADKRKKLTSDQAIMFNQFAKTAGFIEAFAKQTEKAEGTGFLGIGSTLAVRVARSVASVIRPGTLSFSFPGSTTGYGPLVGLDQYDKLTDFTEQDIKYALKCDELASLEAVISHKDEFTNLCYVMYTQSFVWVKEPDRDAMRIYGTELVDTWLKLSAIIKEYPQKYLDLAGIKK